MLCQECKKKPFCKSLCEKAEKYVTQEKSGRREALLEDLNPVIQPGEWPKVATTEAILQLFFLDGKKQQDIADIVMVSRQYVSKVIRKYKPIIADNIKKSVALRRI